MDRTGQYSEALGRFCLVGLDCSSYQVQHIWCGHLDESSTVYSLIEDAPYFGGPRFRSMFSLEALGTSNDQGAYSS